MASPSASLSDQQQTDVDTTALAAITEAIRVMQECKPNDHSNKDSWYAVTVTDLQKVQATFLAYVVLRGKANG